MQPTGDPPQLESPSEGTSGIDHRAMRRGLAACGLAGAAVFLIFDLAGNAGGYPASRPWATKPAEQVPLVAMDPGATGAQAPWTIDGEVVTHRMRAAETAASDTFDLHADAVVEVSAVVPRTTSRAGLIFGRSKASSYLRLVVAPEYDLVAVQRILRGKAEVIADTKLERAENTLHVRIANERLTVTVNGTTLWTSPDRWTQLDGVGLTALSDEEVRFQQVTVKVEPEG